MWLAPWTDLVALTIIWGWTTIPGDWLGVEINLEFVVAVVIWLVMDIVDLVVVVGADTVNLVKLLAVVEVTTLVVAGWWLGTVVGILVAVVMTDDWEPVMAGFDVDKTVVPVSEKYILYTCIHTYRYILTTKTFKTLKILKIYN